MIKPQEQNNILNLPIMVVISSLDQTTEFLRVGIRCGGNGEIAKNYLKLIMLYLGWSILHYKIIFKFVSHFLINYNKIFPKLRYYC